MVPAAAVRASGLAIISFRMAPSSDDLPHPTCPTTTTSLPAGICGVMVGVGARVCVCVCV
jgi:hypothetical protein